MKYLIYILILVLVSCNSNKKSALELNFLNDSLVAFEYGLKKDSINLVKIEIINNSNEIFYFNNIINSDSLISKLKSTELLSKNIFYFKIYDTNKKIISYSQIENNFNLKNDSIYRALNKKRLDYDLKRLKSENNFRYYISQDYIRFFIHPKEKLYFEFYLNLTDTISQEYDRNKYARLSKNSKYISKLFLISDSTNYRNELPRHVLKTIKANNVKVYHGIVESNNTIPIEILN